MKRKRIYILIVLSFLILSFIAEKRNDKKENITKYSMCVPYVSK